MCDVESRCLICGGRLTDNMETRCVKKPGRFEIEWRCSCGNVQQTFADMTTQDHLTLLEMRSGHTP